LGSGGAISKEAKGFHYARIYAGAAKGGKMTAKAKSDKAELAWREKVRSMAKEIWRRDGPLSQDKLAEQILERARGVAGLPHHRQIKRLISEMQGTGELPSKKT